MSLKEINGVKIRNPQNSNEEWWFSYLAAKIDEIGFGEVSLTLTLKNGKVTNIKNHMTESVNLQGNC